MVNIPKLSDIYSSVLTDLQTELGVTIPSWTKSFIKILATVQAAKLYLMYLALANVQKNIFPDTADTEANGGTLERFGRVKLGRMPLPPTQGEYTADISGINGTVIPANTTFQSTDESTNPGIMYVTDVPHTIIGITATITIRALTSGTVGRQRSGDKLAVTQPIAGAENTITINTEVSAPTSGESTEEYRRVVLDSFRLMPAGGASSDYRIWAQDAPGAYRVYPFAASGSPNEVNVYVESSIPDSTDSMGTPSAPTLAAVDAAIEADPITGQGRRPLGVKAVNVLPIVVHKVQISIPSFVDRTTEKESAILAEIAEVVNNIRPFVPGADIIDNKNNILSTHVVVAAIIRAVPGAAFGTPTITLQVGSGPLAPITHKTFINGDIPFLQAVGYV